MSNKTPYEIRLEVLKMAQDVTQQHYYSNRDNLLARWNAAAEDARLTGSKLPEMPEFPEFPQESTIVAKAQFLSEFIDSNGKQKVSKPEFLND